MSVLADMWRAQDGSCFYCAGDTWIPSRESRLRAASRFGIQVGARKSRIRVNDLRASREHLTRRADGGRDCRTNLVMACYGCNRRRGEKSVADWKAEVASQIAAGIHWRQRHGITPTPPLSGGVS